MGWPTTSVPTTNVDADGDSPLSARPNIKSAFDAINSMIASPPLGKDLIAAKTANYTVVSGDHGKVIGMNSTTAKTFTLPALSGLSSDFKVILFNSYKSATSSAYAYHDVDGNSTETINGKANITLSAGEAILLMPDADSSTNWYAWALPMALDTPTDYVKGQTYFRYTERSSNSYVLHTNLSNSIWESFGPTGSGAANIWTALNALPDNASIIHLMATSDCSFSASNGSISVNARRDSADDVEPILQLFINPGGATSNRLSMTGNNTCAMRAGNMFDIQWTATGGTVSGEAVVIYLLGYYV